MGSIYNPVEPLEKFVWWSKLSITGTVLRYYNTGTGVSNRFSHVFRLSSGSQ